MKIRPFDVAKDNVGQACLLIYEAESEIFSRLFRGAKELALGEIRARLMSRETQHSHTHLHVAVDKERMVGILNAYTGKEKNDHNRGYLEIARKGDALYRFPMVAYAWLLGKITIPAIDDKTLYIGDIAVETASRGCGIGTRLLEYSHSLADATGCEREVLEVDVNKDAVRRLYEKNGFVAVEKKTLPIAGGYYHMERRTGKRP